MDAAEAKRLSRENKKPLEDSFRDIESNALMGRRTIILFDIDLIDATKLIGLGYKLEKGIDPMGFEVYKCSW